MVGQRRQQRAKCSLYPLLHDDVSRLLEVENLHFTFHNADVDNSIRTHHTNIMGRFSCHNQSCRSQGWFSMKIAIIIRMYSGERYNARVYHQRCKLCNSLSKPTLDDSYAERVAYRLKKWSGIQMEQPQFSGGSKGPHQARFCEGCKAGHCGEGSRIDFVLSGLSSLSLRGM